MKTSASWCESHSAAIRCSHWFILFRLRCRRSPSLTNWCKYKGTDLRSLSVTVMHELQTEVQSECMTSTLERSKSKNGSLIPFVSALVLKSACPEYCAHHRYPRMFSLALRMAATLRTWSIFFSGPCGWKLSYCYSRNFGWNMEFPRHSHLCVCAWLSTPSCEGMYAASQGAHYPRPQQPFKYLSSCVGISQHVIWHQWHGEYEKPKPVQTQCARVQASGCRKPVEHFSAAAVKTRMEVLLRFLFEQAVNDRFLSLVSRFFRLLTN